ncbi:nucleoside hydrolase [bacterium]|nr:nucleoside hydrolase [bacterium]
MKKVVTICGLLIISVLVISYSNYSRMTRNDFSPSVDKMVVEKTNKKLHLISDREVLRSYRVAIGKNPNGDKVKEGDGRTPEGIYQIYYRNPQSRCHLALHVSYPNHKDRRNARKLGVDPGGDIMIMKIIVDTDIGSDIDDALALLLLLHLENVELLGIVTVYGQVELRAKIARRILDARGLDVPVFAGISDPFMSPMRIWHTGLEGDGILTRSEMIAPIEDFDISSKFESFYLQQIEENPGEIIIVALGALTNIAQVLKRNPEIVSKIGRLYFMGGGVQYGFPKERPMRLGDEYLAHPSHNVRCDVGAAQIVFQSNVTMHIVTNDVTTEVRWGGKPVQDLMNAEKPPEAACVGKLLKVWLDYRSDIFKREITGTCPHDPLTVAEATGNHFIDYAQGKMMVYPDASTSFTLDPNGRHHAGLEIKTDEFLKWLSPKLLAGCDGEF